MPVNVRPARLMCCRVCLVTDVPLCHIITSNLNVMYEIVTGISINSDDPFPQELCQECVVELLSAYNLIEMATKSHEIVKLLEAQMNDDVTG